MRVSLSGLLLLAACSGGGTTSVAPTPASGEYDLVIEGGRVVDGTGAPWFYGDVAVRGGRIAAITPPGLLRQARARDRVSAQGMVVAPGFIDIQSHSRDALLDGDSRIVSKVTQGITTEIMGEGATNAPQNDKTSGGQGGGGAARGTVRDFTGPRGFSRWLEAMEQRGVSANIGSFVGATTIRMYAKGMSQGAATPAELDSMRMAVRNAMQDGAFGIASALIYPPGNYANTQEPLT